MDPGRLAELTELMKQWKSSSTQDEGTLKRGKPKVEVTCKKYAIIFPPTYRPKKKATRRGRSSRSRSKTPPKSLKGIVKGKDEDTMAKDVLAPVNKVRSSNKRVRFQEEDEGKSNSTPKRTRVDVDLENISAENIPLDLVFPGRTPTGAFGLNRDLSPRKRRRLQGLFKPKYKDFTK